MGDLNGQHTAWGSGGINRNGNILYEFIENKAYVILNNGNPTRLTRPNEHISAPDIAFCTPHLANSLTWDTIPDTAMSDHLPCIIKYHSNNSPNSRFNFSLKKYNTNKANWDLYQNTFNNTHISNNDNYITWNDSIHTAADIAIPKKNSPKPLQVSNIWWNDNCKRALIARKEAFHLYKTNLSLDNYINFKKARAFARKTFKQAKKESFQEFCENLNPDTPISTIWHSVKKISNSKNSKRTCPPLNNNIAQDFIHQLAQPVLFYNLPQINPPIINSQPFSMEEFKFALDNKSDTTPGQDNITYSMIQNLPEVGHRTLLNIFNKTLSGNQETPMEWKTQIIYPLPKPGKNLENISGWRPIVFASCVGKLFESMIKNRIEWDLEKKNKIFSFQFGFRKGRSTSDNITLLYSFIANNLSCRDKTIVVQLDLKSAYDNVLLPALYETLGRYDIPLDMCNLILDLLQNRVIQVMNPSTGELTNPAFVNRGLPQGSPLSPLLFNLTCNFIKEIDRNNLIILGYADDLIIAGSNPNPLTTIREINNLLISLSDRFKDIGLSFSPEKCNAICFKNPRQQNPVDPIIIDGHPLPWLTEIRHLGVIFNHNLNWKSQIEHMCGKAARGINIMRFLCRTWWGASPYTLLTLYKAIVRPHLEYGSQVLGKCSKSLYSQLDKLQYQAIRIALGYMKSTPINILLSDSGEIPLNERRLYLALRTVAKVASYDNPVFNNLSDLHTSFRRDPQFWPFNKLPPILEAFHMLRPHLANIFYSYNLPCFLFDFDTIIQPINLHVFNLSKHQDNNTAFTHSINTNFPDHFLIYTDGSKDEQGRTGYGIHTQDNRDFSARLPNQASICDAEVFAIYKACLLVDEEQIQRSLILSDSKSALMRITSTKISAKSEYWALKTKEKIIGLKNENKVIKLGWIPSHTNIKGNELADTLANDGRVQIPFHNIRTSYLGFPTLLKENIRNSWKDTYQDWSRSKGTTYAYYIPTPLKKPWFQNFKNSPRKMITTISRLRSGHCLTREHLNRLHIVDDPNCECGERQTLHHIFFACNVHQHNIECFLSRLTVPKNVLLPLTIHDIIFKMLDQNNISVISQFLSACNLKL